MVSHDIRTFGRDLALVTLGGQLVLSSETQAFRKIIQGLIRSRFRYIIIDLREVDKIDCAGLGELIKCHTRSREMGITIALQNLPRRVKDLLVITRLVALFDCCDVHILRAA